MKFREKKAYIDFAPFHLCIDFCGLKWKFEYKLNAACVLEYQKYFYE